MKLVSRELDVRDFEHCWQLIVGRQRLDMGGKKALKEAWRELLACNAMQGAAIYDIDSQPAQLMAFGASVFVRRAWFTGYLGNPEPYASLSVLVTQSRKDSPILRTRDIARDNCNGGLDLLVVHVGWRTDFPLETVQDIGNALIENFQRRHRGFNIQRMAGEIYGETSREFCRVGGNWTDCSDFADYFRSAPVALPPAQEHPFLMKAIRGVPVPGTALWSMFRFSPPVLRLSQRQQSVLKLAVEGTNRAGIAIRLGISNESVRNCFRAALLKARQHETIGKLFRNREGEWLDPARQREKLIAFLDEHFEELRPWPRRP